MPKRSTHIDETAIREKKGNTAIEEEQDIIDSDGTIIAKKKGNITTFTKEAAIKAAARGKSKGIGG